MSRHLSGRRLVGGVAALMLGGLVVVIWAIWGQQPVPREFDPPPLTTWRPEGCRGVPFTHPALPSREGFRNLHGDPINSNEVSVALTPVMREGWTAEATLYNATGPVFDRQGHLYFSPLVPYENVVLISLDPRDGSRRWAIAGTGAPSGGSTPMVLVDPADPGRELLYLALYDRALAVRTDGTIAWDVPTGLTRGPKLLDNFTLGVNYLPSIDAIAAVTIDGFVLLLDRKTGAPLLAEPYQLPGARTPDSTMSLPAAVLFAADAAFRQFVNLPPGSLIELLRVLLGNGSEVANMFAVDPYTSRLWVAATAPDTEDGTADGVSALGALYRLDVVPRGGGYALSNVCHRAFAGGSASTPTLNAEGSRTYLGDNFGKLLAIDSECREIWNVDLGLQIFGSVGVSADRHEVYAASSAGIFKVVDEGTSGRLVWKANEDVYERLPLGQGVVNMQLVSIGANGLLFQAGTGLRMSDQGIPVARLGTGLLDRQTGRVRYFAEAGEETVAVVNTGPDGAWYIGNSPMRRIFGKVLGLSSAPLRGGVTKIEPGRLDLLVRDATCAAADRAANAAAIAGRCPASADADAIQIRELIRQARRFGPLAVSRGDFRSVVWRRLEHGLAKADRRLARGALGQVAQELAKACNRSVRDTVRRRELTSRSVPPRS